MSKTSADLEVAVALVIENMPSGEVRQSRRQRVQTDRAFATILKLIAPRIRHFIRQYGLVAHWEDAEQCCAIGVHRAIEAYDPSKAKFTTFVNWQLRGELQSLRFRVMTDHRASAKKVEATTVSLHAVTAGADGEETLLEATIVDEDALSRTEAAACDYLAEGARNALMAAYVAHLRTTGLKQLKRRAHAAKRTPAQHADAGLPRFRASGVDPVELAELQTTIEHQCAIVERRLFDDASLDELESETGMAKERVRQLSKRAARTIAELAATAPRFNWTDPRPAALEPASEWMPSMPGNVGLLPEAGNLLGQLTRVSAVISTNRQASSLVGTDRSHPTHLEPLA